MLKVILIIHESGPGQGEAQKLVTHEVLLAPPDAFRHIHTYDALPECNSGSQIFFMLFLPQEIVIVKLTVYCKR